MIFAHMKKHPNIFTKFWAGMKRRYTIHRRYRELSSLSNVMLKDMGLHRSECLSYTLSNSERRHAYDEEKSIQETKPRRRYPSWKSFKTALSR